MGEGKSYIFNEKSVLFIREASAIITYEGEVNVRDKIFFVFKIRSRVRCSASRASHIWIKPGDKLTIGKASFIIRIHDGSPMLELVDEKVDGASH